MPNPAVMDSFQALKKLKLSPEAQVFSRGEEGYAERTKRWQRWREPDVGAVVEVTTTEDVAATIRFANSHNIPFAAFSGGHGGISSLGSLQDSIQIHMRELNSITISPDGTYATIGGGAKGKEVRDALWATGKWTVHGVCDSVGLTAVALGGGHGILQGRYGLLSDQILSLELVLADGTVITVSETSHSELFWAMQGAGHNFGIVTSLDYKIYDFPETEKEDKAWSCETMVWEATAENVRSVYSVAKEMLESGTQPDGLKVYAILGRDPAKSGKVVIRHHVVWNGPLTTIQKFTQPYYALPVPPLSTTSFEGTFLDIPRWLDVDDNAIACRVQDVLPGAGILRFPVDVQTHNLDALAEMTEKFTNLVTTKEEFQHSFVLIEQYPVRAVRAADRSKSAVPWRDNVLLIAPILLYRTLDMATTPPTRHEHLDELAWRQGEELRNVLVEGAKETGGYFSYVNYAYGGESLEEMYGKENLGRLRKLKRRYDPQNKFGFYAPIGLEDQYEGNGEMKRDEL